MEIYNGSFSSVDDVVSNFALSPSDLEGVEILYAMYDGGGYDGWAWVLFRKEGKLFEVNGSHCSCYGLEDQWEPSLSSVKAIMMRPNVDEALKQKLQDIFDDHILSGICD